MVKSLEDIRHQLSNAEFDLTVRVARRLIQRQITELEIGEAGSTATIVEEYPDDKYSSSCLVLGFTNDGRPLHILASLSDTPLLKVITVYEPDPAEWIDYTTRR